MCEKRYRLHLDLGIPFKRPVGSNSFFKIGLNRLVGSNFKVGMVCKLFLEMDGRNKMNFQLLRSYFFRTFLPPKNFSYEGCFLIEEKAGGVYGDGSKS